MGTTIGTAMGTTTMCAMDGGRGTRWKGDAMLDVQMGYQDLGNKGAC
jgi:hypothetical protein